MTYHYNYIWGTHGNDTLQGTHRNDVIVGGNGNDVIYGGNGQDIIYGGNGDDFIIGGFGLDRIHGGHGNDTISWDNLSTGMCVDLKYQTVYFYGGGREYFSSIENIVGSRGNDVIKGDHNNNVLRGNDGNDRLYGRHGDDHLFGDAGHDKIYGGYGNDTIEGGDGNDRILGGKGDDTLVGGLGSDILIGGGGNDTIAALQDSDVLNGTDSLHRGAHERDNLLGGIDGDRFILGDAHGAYYIANGFTDFAGILDFDLGADVIVLHGSASQYSLTSDNNDTSIAFKGDRIGIIQGISPKELNLHSGNFEFV